MCIVFWCLDGGHERFSLILISNRDEFFDRPTLKLHCWPEDSINDPKSNNTSKTGPSSASSVIAGKDGEKGGTWLALDPNARRVCFLTNFREKQPQNGTNGMKSRGHLVLKYLSTTDTESDRGSEYDGFNLVSIDLNENGEHLYITNRDKSVVDADGNHMKQVRKLDDMKRINLERGQLYGISNSTLDGSQRWPKVNKGLNRFQRALQSSSLSTLSLGKISELLLDEVMSDTQQINDPSLLPQTGMPVMLEHQLSSIKVAPFRFNDTLTKSAQKLSSSHPQALSMVGSEHGQAAGRIYGTRSSAVILVERATGQGLFYERTFDTSGSIMSHEKVSFSVSKKS